MFDDYLQLRSLQNSEQNPGNDQYVPFDIDTDYRQYVDGKPRYDGVRSFLASREIELPEGDPSDSPDTETVCGLGNCKNEFFLSLLQREGVKVYPDTIKQVHRWREQGMKTAVISSSRNCAAILEAAEITDLFDIKVDGVDSEQLNLKGKPAPDVFLEAAHQLAVQPQQAMVIEDAVAGVEAGHQGQFGLVIGVNRNSKGESLQQHGADVVVKDLGELNSVLDHQPQPSPLPSALEQFNQITQHFKNSHLALFLDYDGTLSPIVKRPEDAVLSAEMRSLLQQLADQITVAVISGRDLADVKQKVNLRDLHYAGSHGFDLVTADGVHLQQQDAQFTLPDLDQAEQQLRHQLGSIEGVKVERKRFAIAIHYREAAELGVNEIEHTVDRVLKQHPQLRQKSGKKIFELQPDVNWDKGRAIFWLLDQLNLNQPQVMPVYIGDDTTDEDGFQALHQEGKGIGIRVGKPDEPTAADYYLQNPDEVKQFFQALCRTKLNQLSQKEQLTS
jgi:alpha,alpha-trehalase